MAFQTNNDDDIKADINVTPLVDVMLVLLVIFMITTPMMLNGVKLDLPKTQKVDKIQLNEEQIILSISRDLEFYIGEQKILNSELLEVLQSVMKEKSSQNIFLRADETVPYGVVAKAMSQLKAQGITSISLVTELEK